MTTTTKSEPWLRLHVDPYTHPMVRFVLLRHTLRGRRPSTDALVAVLEGVDERCAAEIAGWERDRRPLHRKLELVFQVLELQVHLREEVEGAPAEPLAVPEPPEPDFTPTSRTVTHRFRFSNPHERDSIHELLSGGATLGARNRGRGLEAACLVSLLLDDELRPTVPWMEATMWSFKIWPHTAPTEQEWQQWLASV